MQFSRLGDLQVRDAWAFPTKNVLQQCIHTFAERDDLKDSLQAANTLSVGVRRGRKCLASGPRVEVRLSSEESIGIKRLQKRMSRTGK